MLQNKEGLWKSSDMWNFTSKEGEFVKNNNVKRQQEYANLILFQIKLKDGN